MIDQADNKKLRQADAVSPVLTSCHTAIVGHYFLLEGHVLVADIKRMLKEIRLLPV